MKLTITIEMDNAAFEPCNGEEARRILGELANAMPFTLSPGMDLNLRDINGNKVGKAEVTA